MVGLKGLILSIKKNVSGLNLRFGRESSACASLTISLSACRLFRVTCHNTPDPLARHRRLLLSQVPHVVGCMKNITGPQHLHLGPRLTSHRLFAGLQAGDTCSQPSMYSYCVGRRLCLLLCTDECQDPSQPTDSPFSGEACCKDSRAMSPFSRLHLPLSLLM